MSSIIKSGRNSDHFSVRATMSCCLTAWSNSFHNMSAIGAQLSFTLFMGTQLVILENGM